MEGRSGKEIRELEIRGGRSGLFEVEPVYLP
jgi:hypothetical protein